MRRWLKRIRAALSGLPDESTLFISSALARDVEKIMPGQTMDITFRGRHFVIVEREEFEMLLTKAGFELSKRITESQ